MSAVLSSELHNPHALRTNIRAAAGAALLLFSTSCAEQINAPRRGIRIQRVVPEDSIFAGEPGEFVSREVRVLVTSPAGRPLPWARIAWTTQGSGSSVDGDDFSDERGLARARWRLGKSAAASYRLVARLTWPSASEPVVFSAIAVPTQVAALRLSRDSIAGEVGDTVLVAGAATDPFGNSFIPDSLELLSLDTSRVVVLPHRRLLLTARGTTRVTVHAGTAIDTLSASAAQIVGAITAPDSIGFRSLGDEARVDAALFDRHGALIRDSLPVVELADSTVVRTVAPLHLRAVNDGSTRLRLVAGGVSRDVVASVRQWAVRVAANARTIDVDAIGDTLAVSARAFDALGGPLPVGRVLFRSNDSSVVAVDETGAIISTGNGAAHVFAFADGAVDTISVQVRQHAASIRASQPALRLNAVGARMAMHAIAYDRRSTAIRGALITAQTRDSSIAFIESDSAVVARANGATVAVLRSDTAVLELPINVEQVAATIVGARGDMSFDALAARDSMQFTVYDSLGSVINDAVVEASTDDTAIATSDGTTIIATGNGATLATFSSGPARLTVPILVAQRAAELSVDESLFAAPRRAYLGETLDPAPRAVDRLGSPMPSASVLVSPDTTSVVDTIAGARLRVVGSGWVDLRFSINAVVVTRRLRIYVAPELLEREASSVQLVGLPDTVNPWAPTLVEAPNGATRLYFAGYKPSPGDDVDRADLDYFESTDGQTFSYRGTALPHAPLVTDPYGWGIENIAITPRNDGPGYRMYFAGGSTTLGWQVFSAVGNGVDPWAAEPGIRLPNDGGDHPEGEGMVVLPGAAGGYRMIGGSMVVTRVASGSWQIVEYESNDQMNWTFRREHIAQGADGPGTARAVYSPTIVQFGRGAYRMFYTGDNILVSPTPLSNMWSAVSFDLESWHGEGTFIVATSDNVMYASALGDRVAYLLSPCGGCRGRLAIASIRQR